MDFSTPSPTDYESTTAVFPAERFARDDAPRPKISVPWPPEFATTRPGALDEELASSPLPVLILSRTKRVLRFSPAATEFFSLLPSDIGRPIHDLSQHFEDPAFVFDIMLVLNGRNASKKSVQTEDGRWYIRQTMRYGLRDGTVDSVLITFSEVAVHAQQEARQ